MRYPIPLLLSALAAGPAHALRCGSDIVSEGDSTFALTQRCGPPASVQQGQTSIVTQQIYDPYYNRYQTVTQSVGDPYDVWFYNFGPTRFVAKISVRNGTIIKIDEDGYGY